MNDILSEIRVRVGAKHLCQSCREAGYRVSLTGVSPDRVIVGAEAAFPAHGLRGKRCDYILFATNPQGDLVAAPMELKSGNVDASGVADQLQGGATFAERVAPATSAPVCCPLLFHGRSIHPKERRDLNRLKIEFCGQRVTIKTARCNRPRNLAEALRGTAP